MVQIIKAEEKATVRWRQPLSYLDTHQITFRGKTKDTKAYSKETALTKAD